MTGRTTVITGRQIEAFRMRTIAKGIELELKGLKRRGRSCYAIAKSSYGLKGSRQSVLDQLNAMIEEEEGQRGNLGITMEPP